MAHQTHAAQGVSGWIWAGLAVLLAGLGGAVAVLSGLGGSMACGSFGMGCIVLAYGVAFATLCLAGALLWAGQRAMLRGNGLVGVRRLALGLALTTWAAAAAMVLLAVLVALR